MQSKKIRSFTAVIEKPDDGMDTAFVSIPFDVEEEYGSKGHIKVKALFDGFPYRGIIANMGTGFHVIIVRKDVRAAIGKQPGDKVEVQLELDTDERVVDLPEDLKRALEKNEKAAAFFQSLSYTNKKEYAVWITSAKKVETREKRLRETIEKLLQGLKNPNSK